MYRKLFEFIFFVVLITIMVMSLNLAVADSTAMDVRSVELLKYTFLVVLTISILVRFPITLLGAAAVAIGAGIYAYAADIVIPAELISSISEFFIWLPKYIVGYEAFKLEYSIWFAVLYILFTTLIITLIVFNKKGYGLLIVLGAGAFAFFWFIYVSKARLYLLYYLFAALILYSWNVCERRKKEWASAESKIDKYIEFKWFFNSLLILIVSLLITRLVVLDIKPVQWSWLSEKAVQVFPFIENWRNDYYEGYGFGFDSKYGIDDAGYKTERLGGPVKLSERTMLVIETNSTDSIYLRGSVKDFYTGSNWRKTKKISTEYSTDSQLPLPFSGVKKYSRDIRITHQGLLTPTIFAPNTLSQVEHKSGRFFVDQDNEAYFSRALTNRDSYTVKSVMPFIDAQRLRKLNAYSALSSYTQLPDNISERVKKLALDITSKYDNDYDKAKAIEKYLRENYKYTLTPSEVPEGAEFVDYFLFEGKEGYCTYFATAMAVLLRAADIPCRYVEGFLAKNENSFTRNLRGTDAHAWVEVNFGPYGWLTFEATPAYPLAGYSAEEEVSTAPLPESNPETPAASGNQGESISRDRNLELAEEETGTIEPETREISLSTGIFLTIIAILMLRILYLLAKRAYIEMKINKSKDKQYSAMYFMDILRYLKKINVKMDKEETMREFWHKVKYLLEDDYKNGDEIIRLLEKGRYGAANINDEERNQLEEYRKMMKKFVTSRLGKIKAFISYYIIGY